MSLTERAAIYSFWLRDFNEKVGERLAVTVGDYNNTKIMHDKVKQELDIRAL